MHCHEKVIFFVARMVGVLGFLFQTNPGGGGGTVVAVGHIGKRYFCRKQFFQFLVGGGIVNHPQMVAKTIFGHKIVFRGFVLYNAVNNGINFGNRPVRKKYRFDVGVQVPGQNHPVLLLVGTRQFVFFNNPVVVIVASRGTYNPVLGAAIHGLGINVIFSFGILFQPAFLFKQVVVFHRFVVNFFGMDVGSGGAINLGAGNVQQRLRFPLCHLCGFVGVHHIVRQTS